MALDAAGLQCSEVEADTSKQVFTGLQLDHKTSVLSLEVSRIWPLRRCLEFAARQRYLTGDQVAKLIGHITWSCQLRRPALSLINARPAVAQEFRWIASLLPLLTCNLASPWSVWVYATDASGGAPGGCGVTRRECDSETVAAAGSCAERWRFSAEEFIISALGDQCWSKMSCRKPPGLESKMCHPSYCSPSLLGACCLEVSGGNLWRSYGERVNPTPRGRATRVGLLKAWENGCCSCWTTWPWFWVLQRVAVARQTATTLVAKFVSSLLPRSPSLSADGLRQKIVRPTSHLVQSVSDRAGIPMLTNVGRLQRGQHLTRSCLPSSQPKPHELPVKKRKLEKGREVAPALVSRTKNKNCGQAEGSFLRKSLDTLQIHFYY